MLLVGAGLLNAQTSLQRHLSRQLDTAVVRGAHNLTREDQLKLEEHKRQMGRAGTEGRDDTSRSDTSRWGRMSLEDTLDREDDSLVQKDSLDSTTKKADTTKLEHFGYNLFAQMPEAFKPATVGPVDPGYTVSPGDILRLSIWGQTEFQSELSVSDEGNVFIPVAGQLHVAGIPFGTLEENIKRALSRHYSGLSTNPQRTFMHLTVARMRPMRVFVMGEVEQPGGYTVSSAANVFNSIYAVGGPTKNGSLRAVSVIRSDSVIATVDIYEYLLTGRSGSDVRLQNNDVIFIPPRGKTVAVSGAVFRPAIYELKPDEHFQDLLIFSGGVKSASSIDRAHVRRILPFEQRAGAEQMVRVLDIDLKRHIQDGEEFQLFDQDSLHFSPLFDDDLRNFVKLTGAVKYPGVYQSDEMTLKELVFRHGQIIDNKTFVKRADLIRLSADHINTTVHPVDLERLMTDADYNRQLNPGDEVIVYELDVVTPTDPLVTIEGEVREPGLFMLNENMTVADAILRAGGFTRRAMRTRVDVFRPDTTGTNILSRVYRVILPPNLDYSGEEGRDFVLRDRDRIVIRPDPNYKEENFVTVAGLVKYGGVYALQERNDRLSDILERAGGVLPDAFLKGATITRNAQRVVVDFEAAYHEGRRREDLILHSGDSIYIPPRPNYVHIHGEVNNPGLYGFVEGRRVKDYIDRAGGPADSAWYALITKPNGETSKQRIRGLFTGNPGVQDGSEIVVTRRQPKPPRGERRGPTLAEVIRDTLAIVTSAITIVVLVQEVKKE